MMNHNDPSDPLATWAAQQLPPNFAAGVLETARREQQRERLRGNLCISTTLLCVVAAFAFRSGSQTATDRDLAEDRRQEWRHVYVAAARMEAAL